MGVCSRLGSACFCLFCLLACIDSYGSYCLSCVCGLALRLFCCCGYLVGNLVGLLIYDYIGFGFVVVCVLVWLIVLAMVWFWLGVCFVCVIVTMFILRRVCWFAIGCISISG